MMFEYSPDFARTADADDALAGFRNEFYFPDFTAEEVIYLTGNSLGLQPKGVREVIGEELDDWARWGVEGHFKARRPWFSYHEQFAEPASRIVGAQPDEVVMMNGLTSNIHFLMVSFYRPTAERFKIICEKKAFPSDQYALESQVRHHGLDPASAIVEVGPREGEHLIRHEDILAAIERHRNELALVFIGGVNYYTGQLFRMKDITEAAHVAGALCGFDLAHAAGNVRLALHDWQVDFACWCTYKYLNSGPGSVAGAFVHERHARNIDLHRFAGWWGQDKSVRFRMEPGFRPIPTAEGWQLSNAPVFAMAPHLASLRLFDRAGMDALTKKSRKLTGFLEFVIQTISQKSESCSFEIITTHNPN
jgi:kynureninase